MDKNWKVIFAFAGVFIAGAVTGVAVSSLWSRSSMPKPFAGNPPKPSIEQFSRNHITLIAKRLDLTPEQHELLQPAILKATEELRQLRKTNFIETAEILDRINQDIAKVLTPEQRVRFEKLRVNQRDKLKGLMGAYGVKLRDLAGRNPQGLPPTPPAPPPAAPPTRKVDAAPDQLELAPINH